MNKTAIGIGAFVSIFILGLGYLIINSDDNTNNSSSTSPTSTQQEEAAQAQPSSAASNEAEVSEKAQVTTNNPGVYEEYSEEALASAEGQPVLFFHAPWCFQCREIEEDIVAQGAPAGYTILKVDYDSNQELRNKYGIRLQTSFIKVDSSGEATADSYVAYSEPSLAAVSRDYLN